MIQKDNFNKSELCHETFRPEKMIVAGEIVLESAQSVSAAELYFDFNQNLNTPNASLFLFGNANQSVEVSNLAGFSQNVVLGANGFFNLPIANIYQQGGIGIRDTGFEVQSASAIAGYFINRASASTDMTYLLDSGALDKNYVIATQGTGFGEGSQVAVHAIVDNTQVSFTPKGGAPINVTLNAGETYKYAGGGSSADSCFTYGGSTFAPGISPPPPNGDVSEPAALGLFGLGALALLAARRRAKR